MDENIEKPQTQDQVPEIREQTPIKKKSNVVPVVIAVMAVLIIAIGAYFYFSQFSKNSLTREGNVILHGKVILAELPDADSEGYFTIESEDYGEVRILYRPTKTVGECPNLNVDGVGIRSAIGDEIIVKGMFVSEDVVSACTGPDDEIYNGRFPDLTTSQEILDVANNLEESEQEDKKDENKTSPGSTTYQVARTLNIPYKCTYTAPSFFGEDSAFEAEVIGDDFFAIEVPSYHGKYREETYGTPPLTIQRFAKKDGWAYLWIDRGDGPELAEVGGRFNYKKVRDSITTPFTHFENIFIFAEPAPYSECVKIDSVNIAIPNLPFKDVTNSLIEGIKQGNEAEIALAESVPIDIYLPPHENYLVEYWITADNQGLSDPNRYSIGFRYRDKNTGEALYDIEESKVSPIYYNPPTNCRQIDISEEFGNPDLQEPCSVGDNTGSGTVVYEKISGVRGQEFFFTRGNTLFRMTFYNLTEDSQGKGILTQKELSLIDSFKKIDIGSVLNSFERM